MGHHAHGENSHHQVSRLQHGHHEVICPTPEGTFRNPANCSEFYQCVAGIPYLQFCPDPTTYFSPDCNCCDWKENVACGSHHVVSQRSQKVERPQHHHERLHVLPRQHHLHQTDRGLDLKNYGHEDHYLQDSALNKPNAVVCSDPEGTYRNPANCREFFQLSPGSLTVTTVLTPEHTIPRTATAATGRRTLTVPVIPTYSWPVPTRAACTGTRPTAGSSTSV